MSIKRKLFSNTISNGLQFGSRWILNLLLAQNLTASVFGIFSFIYSIATLIATFFTFGSNLYLLNKVGENKKEQLVYLFESLIITTFLFMLICLVYFMLYPFFAEFTSYSEFTMYGIVLAFIWSNNMNIFSFLKGLGLFEKEARAYILFSIILLTVLGLAYILEILNSLNVKWVFFGLIIINMIPLIVGIIYIRNIYSLSLADVKHNFSISSSKIKSTMKNRFSYGLHEFQSVLFSNLPFIMIGLLMSSQDLGQYKAIYILIVPILILPVVISQVLLNQLTLTKENMPIFKKIFRQFSWVTLFIGLLFMASYLIFGSFVVDFLYKGKFEEVMSLRLLNIFVMTAFLWFIKSNYEVLLTSFGKQWLRVKVLWIALVLYPVAVFLLPNHWFMLRYAVAGLLTTSFMLVVYIIFTEIKLREKC